MGVFPAFRRVVALYKGGMVGHHKPQRTVGLVARKQLWAGRTAGHMVEELDKIVNQMIRMQVGHWMIAAVEEVVPPSNARRACTNESLGLTLNGRCKFASLRR